MTFEEWYESTPYTDVDCARDAWEARVPEGYVLVPVEPTEKMIDAFWNAVEVGNEAKLIDVFTAMIQAAQEEE